MIDINDLFKYLAEKIPDFQKTSKRGQQLFTCVNESLHKFKTNSPTMTLMPGSDKFYCLTCGLKATIYDLIRLVEKKSMTDEEIISFMTNTMKIDAYPELNEYKKYGWYLFTICKNGKVPIADLHWREKEYNSNEKSKWLQIVESGFNLAVNCEFSNVMIVDFDDKEVKQDFMVLRDELKHMLEDSKTLMQNTTRGGKHYVFKYDEELCFKQKVDLGGGLKIDTRTHKGYFLVSPSKINNVSYNWVNIGSEIKVVPVELKSKLLEIIKVDKGRSSEPSNQNTQEAVEKVKTIEEGGRNGLLTSLGGLMIKTLSSDQVEFVLSIINQKFMNPPLPNFEIKAMLGSLDGYKQSEEETQEQKIYECCQLIQSNISARDIIDHVFPGDNKKRAIVNKYLAKFHKEGKLVRDKRGKYDCKQKVEWASVIPERGVICSYKIPYFDDIAYFENGDLILIGTPTGKGKTHISMNIIKQMKEQGIKPYYISLESGSRYLKIAEQLKLEVKDFYVSKNPIENPTQIELEPNAFSIIDWLYTGEDFAMTQSVFKYLSDELRRKGGTLIVFTQLKEDYNYFAVNLIKSFASFAARYIYDDTVGVIGHFEVDKIRESKGHYQTARIDCEFNFDNKILSKKNIL